ncbi:hypothetical protein ACIG56_01570 [Nocardia fusca]|uniref:hypothetical protein n=1 Tax=Nocardia fusca TaxID=941183 RepID=UPI0037C6F94A
MSILEVGFVASLPALCGFGGGVLGGWLSDRLAQRGIGLTAARKIPIVVGLLLSTSIIVCNYPSADPRLRTRPPALHAVQVRGYTRLPITFTPS